MKIAVLVMTLVLGLIFSSCTKSDDIVIKKDNSKILAMVGEVNITQQNADMDMTSTLSDKEKLENLIDNQLLLIKARELKICMSDKEVAKKLSEMRKSMSFVVPKDMISKENMEEELDKNSLEYFRNAFIIYETRRVLGSNIEQVLKQLRENTRIQYNK